MNKIQRIVFTMACLLTSLGGYSYKIVSMGSYPASKCTITATYNSSAVTADTDIPASTSNNVTIHISNITAGYYLEKIEYEYVTDLGQAEAPRRASGPGIQTTKGTISRNSSHTTHYAGDYGLAMPASDIIITAILQECTSISTYSLTLDGTATSLVYNGANHTVTLKNGETTLVNGQDYTVDLPGTDTYKGVFSSSVTVTGCGIYKDTRTQALSITEAPLTITADNKSRDYLDENPTFTTTITGFVGGETVSALTIQPSCATTAIASSPIGSYTITPSGAVATNYSFNYVAGTLTINQRNIGSTSTKGQAVISLSESGFDTSDNYFNYNGNVQTPTVDVSYNSNPLSEGTDYTSATSGCYTDASDKSKPDIYTITVTFLGNYTGTKTATYQIRPKLQLKDDDSYRWEAYYNTETYNMKVPTGVQVWVVNGFNTTAVELTGKEVIKTQTPMLLFRAGSTKTFYPELTAETPTWTGGSYLKYHASPWDLTHDDDIQNGNTKICILVRDNFVRTVSGTLAAGKCYLDLSGTTYFGAPLRLDITPTSIDTPEKTLNDLNNGKWYTLDGRQIQGVPTQKGIYIVNGKKIIIK